MPEKTLRLAVVSTPRVGNTWIRTLLARAYDIPGVAYHELTPEEWLALPEECVLQIHWRREPEFETALQEHGFQILTIARHPLDVLVSILQFSVHTPETSRWLQGRCGDETEIWGAMPRSRSFIEYATGPRAAQLLAVTPDWWEAPGVTCLRYEDFVADAVHELNRLAEVFGPLRADPSTTRDSAAMGRLPSTNSHFWQGLPGLWRSLLPDAEAREIAAAHAPLLLKLGYRCDPDPTLTAASADRMWVRLSGPALRAGLDRAMSGHRAQIEEYLGQIARLQARLSELESSAISSRAAA